MSKKTVKIGEGGKGGDEMFQLDDRIVAMFPGVKLAVLEGRGLDNRAKDVRALVKEAEAEVRGKYALEGLSGLPKIADWREAYRKFGFKPSEYRSSVEALVRRVLQGKELPTINPIVDLYNVISIKHLLPVGGDDLDKVAGNIRLTIAAGGERFVMLGGGESEPIKKGEVIYRDDKEVLCRCWNYRECDKSKITNETKNVCLVVEGLGHTSAEELGAAVMELKTLLSAHCGGEYLQYFPANL